MKTIEQLLQLTKNPYYVFTIEERQALDDFLLRAQDSATVKSPKKSSSKLSKKTNVTVRNVVRKVNTYPPELIESVS